MSRMGANAEQVVVQLLQHQLDLAIGLLRNARECREAVFREREIIQAAREAYRYSMEAVIRLPQLSRKDAAQAERSAQKFRSALSQLCPERSRTMNEWMRCQCGITSLQ
jgi:hypothetical protein